MPKDNIDRAIKKGTGELEGGRLEEGSYEGYAAGGIAEIVKVLTDNKNRSAAAVSMLSVKLMQIYLNKALLVECFKEKAKFL